jgi:hypothetical protein
VPNRLRSAGDALPQGCADRPLSISVSAISTRAEEFIVDWARDLPAGRPWALVVHLDRPAGRVDESTALQEAIHDYFGQRVIASRRRLRELFRRGRISLVIALAFLTASIAVGDP